jgi:hypothetical protein
MRSWGAERGQSTLEWLGAMAVVVLVVGGVVTTAPALASKVAGTAQKIICSVGAAGGLGGDCATPAAPAPAPAPPMPPPVASANPGDPNDVGPPSFQSRSCDKGGKSLNVTFRLQHKRDPDTGQVFNVIDGVSYRLNGPYGPVKLWVFQRGITTYVDTGKRPGGELPGPNELNGAELLIGQQTVTRDGRAHQLPIGEWSHHDAPIGTYVLPDTKGILQVHYDYVFVIPGGGGCSFHFDG